jgi:hypothetical protein
MGEDGKHGFIGIDPKSPDALTKDQNNKIISINPNIGSYDVRCSVGPSFTSVREEAAQNIIDISQGNPALGAALAPLLMKMRDMPESDKAYRIAISLLPPPVQKAYEGDEGEGEEINPQVEAIKQQAQQAIEQAQMQCEQLKQGLQEAAQEHDEMTAKLQKAELDLQRERALSDINNAKHELQTMVQQSAPVAPVVQPEPVEPRETAPQKIIVSTSESEATNEAMLGAMAGLIQGQSAQTAAILDAVQQTGQQNMAAVAEMSQAMTMALTAPKTATLSNGKTITVQTGA